MTVQDLTPILNVSDIVASFAWFELIGWKKLWDWGTPPTFGAVGCGECEIFLCQGAQGSRGGPMPKFTGDDETGGVWMSWFLSSRAEVDAAHALIACDMASPSPIRLPTSPGAFANFISATRTATRSASVGETSANKSVPPNLRNPCPPTTTTGSKSSG